MPEPDPFGPVGSLAALLDGLERHRSTDVGNRLVRARRLAARAAEEGDDVAGMRARLVAADMLHRTGRLAEGFRQANEVRSWAETERSAGALARSHLVLAAVHAAAGDAAAALDHAVMANESLDADASARERGNHLLCLADSLALVGATEESRRRYEEAQSWFAAGPDDERALTALNNLVVLECEVGNTEAAVTAAEELARRAMDLQEMNPSYAETIARARLAAGDLGGALAAVHLELELLTDQGDNQAVTPAELLLAHAEISLATGRLDQAAESLRKCRHICEHRGLAGMAVETIRVEAEIHAAAGRFEAAYLTYRRFHTEALAQRARDQEAAARTRHELFETAEARRDAERFWRQARTDGLTGLANRRAVDEGLPRLLARAELAASSVVATIIDVDHFKLVNDRFSHAVGDEVLKHLAGVLETVGSAFVARLGGEEFVLVDSFDRPDRASDPAERARRLVEAYDWALVADGLAVTISAGVATAQPGDTQRTLLARADRALYAAKAAGRNRVVVDDSDRAASTR